MCPKKVSPLNNQSFIQMDDVTDLAAVDSFPAESPKSRSPPDWDLDCSVANPVGWWSRVSLLTAVQQSHGLDGLEHRPAGRWRNHQTQNEWLAATVVSTACDVDHLKERLIEEWCRFDQNIIDRAVNQWCDRLCKCVRAKGGHFEHLI